MYHDVRPVSFSWFPQRFSEAWAITPEVLRDELKRLKASTRNILDVRRPRDVPGIYVTFDDGLKDHLRYAAPICEELGIPAVFFLSSDCVNGGGLTVGHKIQFALASRTEQESARWLFEQVAGARPLWDDYSVSSYKDNIWSAEKVYVTAFLRRHAEHVDAFFDWACPVSEEEIVADFYLDAAEVGELAGRMAVGGHGHSHTPLAGLGEAEVRAEIEASCNADYCNTRTISYPHGSFDDRTLVAARACGLTHGFSVRNTLDDNLTIPRVCGATNRLPF
jgi:peptidoglycan/xylan/chitin deacetylase (PgdA/CDA1 family)